ncbi:MAG: magnesium transporter [Nitrososphaerales archaeon]
MANQSRVMIGWRAVTIVRVMGPLLMILAFVGMFSGLILTTGQELLFRSPALFILVPAVVGLGGNLGAIIGSRVSTALHLGIIEPSLSNIALRNNIISSLIAGGVMFIILGIVAGVLASFLSLKGPSMIEIFLISTISGVFLVLFVVIISVAAAFFSYRRGLDPDDVVIPVVTSFSDLAGIAFLMGIVVLILG